MESTFQFTNPVLTKMLFNLNNEFDSKDNAQVSVRTRLSVNISKDSKNNEGLVNLHCEIGEQSNKCPYWIEADEQAVFRWDSEMSEELSNDLLNQNAPALLLGYLRPIIAQVTSASRYGAYNIPFMNFTKENRV